MHASKCGRGKGQGTNISCLQTSSHKDQEDVPGCEVIYHTDNDRADQRECELASDNQTSPRWDLVPEVGSDSCTDKCNSIDWHGQEIDFLCGHIAEKTLDECGVKVSERVGANNYLAKMRPEVRRLVIRYVGTEEAYYISGHERPSGLVADRHLDYSLVAQLFTIYSDSGDVLGGQTSHSNAFLTFR
jgi:hypothetical protein